MRIQKIVKNLPVNLSPNYSTAMTTIRFYPILFFFGTFGCGLHAEGNNNYQVSGVLLEDNFNGSVLDSSLWSLERGSVSLSGGILKSTGRGTILSKQDFSGPKRISIRVRLDGWPAVASFKAITNGETRNSYNELKGVGVFLYWEENRISLIDVTGGTRADKSLSFQDSDWHDLVINDYGTSVKVILDDQHTLSLDLPESSRIGNKVAFYSRSFGAGSSLDSFKIESLSLNQTGDSLDLTNGLVAYYPFDGNASDMSGYGNHGIVNGATLGADRHGIGGKAYYFSKDSDIIETSLNLNLPTVTVTGWFKSGSEGWVFGNGGSGGSFAEAYLKIGSEPYFNTGANEIWATRWVAGPVKAPIGTLDWQHFAVVFRKDSTALFRDGTYHGKVFSIPQSKTHKLENGGFPNVRSVNSNWVFGAQRPTTVDQFNGAIDGIRIYNRALSEEEVAALYELEKPFDLMTGLVAYYPFDGNASDMSGYDNHGTVNGATLRADRHGITGKAYSFDGTNDYIEVPYSPAINSAAFSYSTWVKASSLVSPVGSPITSRDASPPSGYMLYKFSDDKWRAVSGTGTWWQHVIGADAETGKWVNLTFTYDDGNGSLFQNGVLQSSLAGKVSSNTSKPLRFGSGATEGTPKYFFNGSMDDTRIYNRALTATEVAALYDFEKPLGHNLPSYNVSLVANPDNGGEAFGAGVFRQGNSTTISATSKTGYLFTGWSGDVTGTINPLTLTVDAAKTIAANFSQDLNDTDGDGLSNYAELVTYETKADDNDTDDDGLLDNEEIQIGTDPKSSDATLVNYLNSKAATRETSARTNSLAEGRSTGIATVKAAPSEHGLYTQADLNASAASARTTGIAEGRSAGVAEGKALGRSEGQAAVKADPTAYGLAPIEELTASGATPYTNGWYYQPDWGWIWTNAKTFPYVYRSSSGGKQGGWLYFREGTADPILFYSYAEQKWVTLGEYSAKDSIVDKWAEWEANPEPYGGLEVLAKIHGAKESDTIQLDIVGEYITDLTPFAELTSLRASKLRNNHISDITPLAKLTRMEALQVNMNRISDISPLAGLTNLTNLVLHNNQIVDISPLAGLTGLDALSLEYNQIVDLTPLEQLTKLTWLNLSDNQITDISSLENLSKLENLWLERNWISNISSLAGSPDLIHLALRNNQIKDISPLAALTKLDWLYLSGNDITDVTPLAGLTTLKFLYLGNNPISANQKNMLEKALPNCEIYFSD